MQVSVVIIEDELPNSRMLKGLIERIRPEYKLLTVLESIAESVAWLKQNKAPQLLLMDIQLSDGICFSIFDEVELTPETRIIFTTAYDEYAIQAFKVNSIDYLLKPIEENDLEAAITKFEQQAYVNPVPYSSDVAYYRNLIQSILEGKKEYRQRLLIAGSSGYQKLETADIAYFYSNNKLTFAVCFNKHEHIIDYTLEQLESELEPNQFFRANRKVILNVSAVGKINNEPGSKLSVQLTPKPDFDIIVSRLKATEFKLWLGK